MAAAFEIRGHAGAQIAREALGDLDFDLERRQIDHREQRRILGNAGAIGHLHLADLAVHRRSHVQAIDLALQVRHQVLLAVEQRLLAVDVEPILLRLRLVVHLRLLKANCAFSRESSALSACSSE